MVEGGVNRYQLYQRFAENKERSALKRYGSFGVSYGASLPIGIASMANPEATAQFVNNHPEANIVFAAMAVSMGITSIGAFIESLDITRVNSANGRIAQEIAHIEGRDSQTTTEKKREIHRVRIVVNASSNIAPTRWNLLEVDINNWWARHRSRKHPEALEEKAVSDAKFRKARVKATGRTEFGYPQDPQILMDALLTADKRWESLAEDPKQPEHRIRFAVLMRAEIRRRLAEHLGSALPVEAVRRVGRYERMSPQELDRELRGFIAEFPVRTYGDHFITRVMRDMEGTVEIIERKAQEEGISIEQATQVYFDELWGSEKAEMAQEQEQWQRRRESEEKKALFEQLRKLTSRTPTTRAYQEVLLRELESLYVYGLEASDPGIFNMEDPLLGILGYGKGAERSETGGVFDPAQAQEAERRLYGYVKNKFKTEISFDPIHHDADEVRNPLKRWILNRKEDVFAGLWVIGDTVFKVLPQPSTPIEKSWEWEYKARYNEKLKPLNGEKS